MCLNGQVTQGVNNKIHHSPADSDKSIIALAPIHDLKTNYTISPFLSRETSRRNVVPKPKQNNTEATSNGTNLFQRFGEQALTPKDNPTN